MSHYLAIFALSVLAPLALAIYQEGVSISLEEGKVAAAFFWTFIITLVLASLFTKWGNRSSHTLYRREGIAASVLIWFLTPALAALPFLLSGTLTNPAQAYFEMVSGFTTTGATILYPKNYDFQGNEIPIIATVCGVKDTIYTFFGTVKPFQGKIGIEAVNSVLLFWRSLSQWLGGMGIIVLFVAILPALGAKGKVLIQSEITGPSKEGTTPRIKDTALILWRIYLSLTLLQIGMLLLFNPNLTLFDASAITFSTISTGGFSILNEGLAGYHSTSIEWIVTFFMLCGSINFAIYGYLLKGKFHRFFDPEAITYLLLITLFTLSLFSAITGLTSYPFRVALFQSVSTLSSTGFSIADNSLWPPFAYILLLIGMFIGGMSGSTAGGIKIARILILFKIGLHRIESIFRPFRLKKLKIGSQDIDDGLALTVLCFFLMTIFFAVFSTFFYVMEGVDPGTALSLTASMISNSGMNINVVESDSSCVFLSSTSLLISSVLMICGRLEYFAVLCLFVPAFWTSD